jgi:hypothetical protein
VADRVVNGLRANRGHEAQVEQADWIHHGEVSLSATRLEWH